MSFHHLSREDGLSNPFNSYVYQDSRGFLWISSLDGLNRFDGKNVKIYRPDPTDENALTGNIISSNFFEDGKGDLWFTSYGALHVYVRSKDHFKSFQLKDLSENVYREDYNAFHLDNEEYVWLRTGYGKNGLVHRFNTSTLKDTILGVIDGQRNYLVSTPKGRPKYLLSTQFSEPGLEIIDIEDPLLKVRKFFSGGDSKIPRLKTHNAYPVNSDTILIGTEKGLVLFSLDSTKFKIFTHYDGNPVGRVWSVYPLNDKLFVVSTATMGLLLFDLESLTFLRHYDHDPTNNFSLKSSDVREVYIDRAKTLWVSIWGEGLDFASFNKNNFSLFNFNDIIPGAQLKNFFSDSSGNNWCNLGKDGILILDERMRVKKMLSGPGSSRDPIEILNVLLDNQSRIWALASELNGSGQILYRKSDEDKPWVRIGGLQERPVSLYQLSNERILLPTLNGIWEIIENGTELSIIPCPELAQYQNLPFYRIYEDNFGQVYFTANYDRIAVYEIENDQLKFRNIIAEVGDVKGFCESIVDSTLWLATSSGLFKLNKNTLDNQLISGQKSGLTNESILSVLEDGHSNLWLKTQGELLKYHPDRGEIRRYNQSNGIQENIQTQIPVLQTIDGSFWIGGSRGITFFNPEDIHDYPASANARIVNITVNGEKLVTDTFVAELSQISLPYDQNTLSMEFVACDYSDPKSIRFRYRMQNFDQEWVDGGDLGFARYANLPAGHYNFTIQVANADGIWSDHSTQLKIQILPPWWQTWWARSLYILGIFLLFFGFYRWRTMVHRRKLRARDLELKQERRLNERLRQVDQLKDQFLANTSHELRTPLIGIIGLAESLIDGATGTLSDLTRKNLSLITASGKRLAHLIDDILDFSRINNQDLELHKTAVDLYAVSELVITLLKPSLQFKQVVLENQVPKDIPLIGADEDRLQQILFNLLGNAIKFTDRGEIILAAEVLEDFIEISVSDTGIGIEKDKLERIFQSFEQADGSSSRSYGGAGLGLTITKQLVELHGGEIKVKSRPGHGSIFTFSIPMTEAGQIPREKVSSEEVSSEEAHSITSPPVMSDNLFWVPEPKNGASSIRILIVDDEFINLQVLHNHLSLEGYQIFTAGSGQEALDLIDTESPFDLIILDIMMPRMSGFEVCQKLRKKFLPSQLPIIMLTAKNQITDLVEGFDAGANDYLGKPFSKDELLSRIKTHLRLHRINTATGKFVPYEFLHSIGRDEITEVQLGDHAYFKEISVLFADIRGYTTLSEKMTPQQNFKFVNAFVGRMGPVIEKYDGIIEQYLGDAILAIFPKSPADAVKAAIEMQKTIQLYNGERISDGRNPLQIGIGIHSGPLIMGVIGDLHRTDTAIIADTVNIASRFEGLTKYYGANILISETCYQKANDAGFHFRFLGAVKVKGKNETNRVYECINGDPELIFQKKKDSERLFALGVEYYMKGEFGEASTCFQTLLRDNQKDDVARSLMLKSAHYLSVGAPSDWQGVELMDSK